MAENEISVKVRVDTEEGMKSTKQMKDEIKLLTKQMGEAAAAGDKATFDKLKKNIGELKNDFADLNAEMKASDPGELLSGYVKMAQGAVGAFSVVTGAMSMFGAESERIQEIEKKSAVLIQTMIGLESLRATFIDKAGRAQLRSIIAITSGQVKMIALGIKQNVVQALQTVGVMKQAAATETATVAQLALNKAANASIYAALAAAVLYLGNAYYEGFKKSNELNDTHLAGIRLIDEYTKKLADMKDSMDAYTSSIDTVISAYRDLGNEMIANQGDVAKYVQMVVDGATIMMSSTDAAARELSASVVAVGADFNNFNKAEATQLIIKLDAIRRNLSATDNAGRNVSESNKILYDAIGRVITGLGAEGKAVDKMNAGTKRSSSLTKKLADDLTHYGKVLDDIIAKEEERMAGLRSDTSSAFVFDPDAIKLYYKLLAENEAASEQERTSALLALEEIRYQEELALAGDYAEARRQVEIKHEQEVNKIRNAGLYEEIDRIEQEKEAWLGLFAALKSGVLDTAYADAFSATLDSMSRLIEQWDGGDELYEKLAKAAEALAGISSAVTSAYISDLNERTQATIDEINQMYDEQAAQQKKRLDSGLVSQADYDATMSKMEAERLRKEKDQKRKAFEQERTAQIINATIQTLMATLNAYSSGMAYPLIGPATAITFAAIAAAFGGAQIGLIASEKNPYARGGLITGASHAAGGEDVNVEGGEVILNKRSMSVPAYRAVASAINTAGGGAPIGMEGVSGGAAAIPITTELSPAAVESIVSGIAAIPVIVTERDITRAQRRVAKVVDKTTF